MVKHDENKDLKSFSRVGRVNIGDTTLRAPKSAVIGIRMWGKIDYLTHYCGWHFMYDNSAVGKNQDKESSKANVKRKAKKEDKGLVDKNKKNKRK